MTAQGWGIYTLPADQVTAAIVGAFLDVQRIERLMTESLTCELKVKRSGANVARAVAALANSMGGVVIVGVDENEPELCSAPGLPEGSVEGLAQHLREVISPKLAPEFIPVRVPGADKMIVVIRIEPEPTKRPVVCGGSVMLRGPGITMAATHEQIVDLVCRRGAGLVPASPTYSVRNTHNPSLHDGREDTRGDYLIRLASAVYLRDRAQPFTFGREVRERFEAALVKSAFAHLAGGWRRRPNNDWEATLPVVTEEFRSTFFSARIDYVALSEEKLVDRLRLKVQVAGNQVSFYIEVEARRPSKRSDESERTRAGRAATLGREEMLLVLLLGIETISNSLVPAIVEVGGSPLAVDDVAVWVEDPSGHVLSDVLDLERTYRQASKSVSTWTPDLIRVADLDEAVEAVRAPLETFYVDLGIEDEVRQSDQDLNRAAANARHLIKRGAAGH